MTVCVCAATAAVALGGARAAAPDRGLIVFVSDRDGPSSLYAIHPDGTHMTRLVRGVRDPRVSPTGENVLYDDAKTYREAVLDLATGRRHVLPAGMGEGSALTERPWSPDGSHFAMGNSNGGIWIVGADGSGRQQITTGDDGEPAWSPDGTLVAFGRNSGPAGLYVVGVDGTGLRRIVADGDEPEWSPDGREIAYTNSNVVTWVVPATGGAARRIAPGFAAWSPDGRMLAVADEDGGGLALYRPDGSLVRVLLRHQSADSAAWSPDGRTVLAVVDGDLWLFASDGSRSVRLTQGARYGYTNEDPTWSTATPAILAGTPVGPAVPYTGPLVSISRATGGLVPGWPQISARAADSLSSSVNAIADDGHGGWYVGGDFLTVGGVACPNLVHLGANGSVDRSWCPSPDGVIEALVRVGRTLYVGGERMHRLAGSPRSGLAAFDVGSGRLTSWSPFGPGDVWVDGIASEPSGHTLYFFGSFTHVGAFPRSNLAAVDMVTGRPTAFAPNPNMNAHGDGVTAIAVTATRVYAWGYFDRIGGHDLRVLGDTTVLDAGTGRFVSAAPKIDGVVNAAAVDGDRVVVAGDFSHVGGRRRNGMSSFSGASGVVDGWAPAAGQPVERVTIAGTAVVAARPKKIAAFDRSNDRLVWQSRVTLDGGIAAVAASASLVLVGGSFRDAHS